MKRVTSEAVLYSVVGSFPAEYVWVERILVASSPETAPTLADYLEMLKSDDWEVCEEHEVPKITRRNGGTVLRYDLRKIPGNVDGFNYMIVWAA